MAASNRIDFSPYAFWSFTLSIVLLPIGLGGDRPIPLGLAQAGLAFSSIFIALSPALLRTLPFFARLRWAFALLAAVFAWALIQTQAIVPESWAHPLWQEAAAVLKKPLPASISIVPEDGLKGLMRLLTYCTAGLLAYVLAQNAKRAQQFVTALWISGTVICLYGLLMQLTGLQQILWFDKWAYLNDVTGTFVNRNHFAIYAGIVLTAGIALMMQSWRESLRTCKPHQRVAVIREWLLRQGMPRLILSILTLVSIALSHSRAGLVWSLIGLGSYLFFYHIYLRSWRRAFLAGFMIAVVLILSIGIAFQVSDRFAVLFDDYSSQERSQVYELSWRALADNPWLGYGLNGFEPEYRLYQHNMYEEFNHAHSDVLESLLDLGLIGGLTLWAAIAVLLSGLWHGIRSRRQHGLFPTLALAASLMVLGHAMVDFDLQIPGVAMTWTALLGVGLAQSWRQTEKKSTALA
jgi:O-antigen ligase